MQNFSGKGSNKQSEGLKRVEEEHKQSEEKFGLEKVKKAKKKKTIMAAAIIIAIILIGLIIYYLASPGKYDDFAKCLTEKGVVMKGEDWCQYTKAQKAMFGKSFKYIDYQVESDLEIRPTWIIDGDTYERVQSFQTLSELTGCQY